MEKTETENKTSGSGFLSGLFGIISLLALMAALLGLVRDSFYGFFLSSAVALAAFLLVAYFAPKSAFEESEEDKTDDGEYCHKCGEEIAGSYDFCSHCGQNLNNIEKYKFCSSCGRKVIEEDSEYCSGCGAPLEELDSHCPSCGDDMDSPKTKNFCSSCGEPAGHSVKEPEEKKAEPTAPVCSYCSAEFINDGHGHCVNCHAPIGNN